MAAQTAQIIDLEERRRMRRAAMVQDHVQEQPFVQPPVMFVPVWFTPVFFIGSPAGQA